ncbi:MAG: SLC13 family permease, partial [Ancrocorticia populi]|uniref:SLC13 family permease n=1 Tax=Ancrocorticia populi TaxID=2175228 RepID=UPI003F9051E9
QSFSETAAPYASGTIFLFMGGFFLAASIQKWNLHKRIALVVVKLVGAKPKMIVLGFMIATGLVTMWVSNTATAIMMLPIGLSVLRLVAGEKASLNSNFGKALMLGIAYSASTIATSSLISTPPNALLRAYLADNFDITLTFGKWLLFASPMAWAFLFIIWFVLVTFLFPPEVEEIPGGQELIARELEDLGPMSQGERRVGGVFIVAALSWLFLPTFFEEYGVTDELVAIVVATLLFLIPVKGEGRLLDGETATTIPWDILLLFGGGLALSHAFTRNGLSAWIGDLSTGIGTLPVILVVLVVTTLVMALTEMTSNTATAATFLPVMGGVAAGIGHDVMLLVVPVALASTCSFMLPHATPPNAVAYSTGYLKMGDMIKTGLIFNIIGIVLITATTLVMGPLVLGVSLS